VAIRAKLEPRSKTILVDPSVSRIVFSPRRTQDHAPPAHLFHAAATPASGARLCQIAALFLLLASATWSQQLGKRITNKDVIDMAGVGLCDDVIIFKIRSAGAGEPAFDTSVDGLKELKAAKVSDEVIEVMINPNPGSMFYTSHFGVGAKVTARSMECTQTP
jgi:hypothetical protein